MKRTCGYEKYHNRLHTTHVCTYMFINIFVDIFYYVFYTKIIDKYPAGPILWLISFDCYFIFHKIKTRIGYNFISI